MVGEFWPALTVMVCGAAGITSNPWFCPPEPPGPEPGPTKMPPSPPNPPVLLPPAPPVPPVPLELEEPVPWLPPSPHAAKIAAERRVVPHNKPSLARRFVIKNILTDSASSAQARFTGVRRLCALRRANGTNAARRLLRLGSRARFLPSRR